MLLSVVLCASLVQARDLAFAGSQKHYVVAPPPKNNNNEPQPQGEATMVFPSVLNTRSRSSDIIFPVKTVKKFTDDDGNIQVVTSYTNKNIKEDIPLAYKPDAKTSHIHIEERTPIKTKQLSKTQTIRFPDQGREQVDHEEQISVSKGEASSYKTESVYDNAKNSPHTIPVVEPRTPQMSIEGPPKKTKQNKKHNKNKDKGKKKNGPKDSNVPSASISKSVKELSPKSGSFHVKSIGDTGHSASKNFERPLQESGSSYISDFAGVDDDYDIEYEPSFGVPGHVVYGHGHGGEGGGSFERESGTSYKQGEHYTKGGKEGKGHKSSETYDKGHLEKHGEEEQTGGKKEEEGHKTGHLDEGKHFEKGHAHHKGAEGVEKKESKGHKKGHKTSGFRTVHHKDEYKKDEVFYDEEHDTGHIKKHGHNEGAHEQAKGGETKKGHLDSGYKEGVKGYEGSKTEGQKFGDSKGHNGHEGHKSGESHKEGWSKEAGNKAEKEHAHEAKAGY